MPVPGAGRRAMVGARNHYGELERGTIAFSHNRNAATSCPAGDWHRIQLFSITRLRAAQDTIKRFGKTAGFGGDNLFFDIVLQDAREPPVLPVDLSRDDQTLRGLANYLASTMVGLELCLLKLYLLIPSFLIFESSVV